MNKYNTWKDIRLGTGLTTPADFRKALRATDCAIYGDGEKGGDILDSMLFKVSPRSIKVHLVRVSVADLGFASIATCDNIYRRAKEAGLDLCPAEVGPQLCLQYHDHPQGLEWLHIGMTAVPAEPGLDSLVVFGVGYEAEKRQLFMFDSDPDRSWDIRTFFVFRQVGRNRAKKRLRHRLLSHGLVHK